jgi:hypothetical protein
MKNVISYYLDLPRKESPLDFLETLKKIFKIRVVLNTDYYFVKVKQEFEFNTKLEETQILDDIKTRAEELEINDENLIADTANQIELAKCAEIIINSGQISYKIFKKTQFVRVALIIIVDDDKSDNFLTVLDHYAIVRLTANIKLLGFEEDFKIEKLII